MLLYRGALDRATQQGFYNSARENRFGLKHGLVLPPQTNKMGAIILSLPMGGMNTCTVGHL